MKNILILCFILSSLTLSSQVIFPTPNYLESRGGDMLVRGSLKISSDIESDYVGELLSCYIFKGIEIDTVESGRVAKLQLIEDSLVPKDGYILDVTKSKITIKASTQSGFLYGVQSLRQIASSKDDGVVKVPTIYIEDAPRKEFRSFMLDSGRQYQSIEKLKQILDLLSILKINYFHWHLTEGLGWRVEIKKYPLLTKIGSQVAQGEQQQGFYSQDEIKEVVSYASDRAITIIPEIDIPGHAEAAIRSYPLLGCFNDSVEIPELGFTQNIFCAGKDFVVEFMKDVLDEVVVLFPSQYIHIGGDEAPKQNWDRCEHCQGKIESLGLKTSHDLQLWLTNQLANHLAKYDRKAICWGDVVRDGDFPLPKNVIVHWWNWRRSKDKEYVEANSRGLEVVCNTNYYSYLNFPVTPWGPYKEDRTFDMSDIYLENPSYYIDFDNSALGMGVALWSDGNLTEEMLIERIVPRIFAITEQMWYKGELKDFEQFKGEVEQKQRWFENLGYNYGDYLRDEN